jgi:pyruvate kinase
MSTRTKIICTIGPSVSTYEKILELMDAGMNVARLNFSHGTHEYHLGIIQLLKKAREERNAPLAIMLDTKGPEIRLGKVPSGALSVSPKDRVHLVRKEDGLGIQMNPEIVFDFLEIGTALLFDDGYILSKVVEKTEDGVLVEIQNTGVLKNQKGVNIPGVQVPLPAMTKEDIESITFGCFHGVDLIAASFIRSAQHVKEIKNLLKEQGKSSIAVIAKIEDTEGVQNFDEILKEADGIMVARGDLGVELPLQEVPSLQKMMIAKSINYSKPVITATQMLESMIKNPRPTRAEVSDVANAIYDSTSAVMLSGETAIGAYPIETVKMMKNIILEAEKKFMYRDFFHSHVNHSTKVDTYDMATSVAFSTVNTAYSLGAKAIFAFTSSGSTARLISRFRPEMPVFALSPTIESYHRMALLWGITPVPPKSVKNIQEAFRAVCDFGNNAHVLTKGDCIVITAGEPFGITGTTNMMIVEKSL